MKPPYALILLVAASTAYGQIDNPPTPSSIGLGTTNDVAFNKISLPAGGGTNDLVLQLGANNTGFYVAQVLGTPAVFVHNDAQVFAAATATFSLYKPLSFVNPTNADITRTNLSLGATNNVTFSNVTVNGALTAANIAFTNNYFTNATTFATNVTVGGTLAVTGNVTLSGTDNLAPSQTTNSASSLMTRSLSDTRYGEWVSQTEMGQLEFTTETVSSTTFGGSYSAGLTNILYGPVLRMYAFTNTGDYSVVNVNAASLPFLNTANAALQGQGTALYVRALAAVGSNRVARILYGGVSSNQVAGIVGTNGIDRRGFALEIAPTTNSSTNNLRLIAQDGTNGNVASAWVPVSVGGLASSYFMAHNSNATRVYYGSDSARPSQTPVITLNHTWLAGTTPSQPTGILFSVVNTNNDTSAGNLFIRAAWQMINADLVGY